MSIESWTSDLVSQWLVNIGLGPFASVLNADNAFTGKDLLATSLEELVKIYKLDKKPARKIITERNKAMAYLHVKPQKRQQVPVEIGRPYGVVHAVHVQFVPGKGLRGLPKEWKDQLLTRSSSLTNLLQTIQQTIPSKKRESCCLGSNRHSKRLKGEMAAIRAEEVMRWSVSQVAQWLPLIQLPIFISDFEFAGINGKLLLTMSYPDLLDVLGLEMDMLSEKLFRNIAVIRETSKRSKSISEKVCSVELRAGSYNQSNYF